MFHNTIAFVHKITFSAFSLTLSKFKVCGREIGILSGVQRSRRGDAGMPARFTDAAPPSFGVSSGGRLASGEIVYE
jgi:hypothetical protein